MKYTDFVTQYTAAKDKAAFVKKHIKAQYISYATKEALAKSIAKTTSWATVDGKEVYQRNTCTQQFLIQMHLISNYTDIKFEPQDSVLAYDALSKCGALEDVLAAIPETERLLLCSMTDMCASDIYTNFRDLPAYIDSKLQAMDFTLGSIVSSLGKAIEENPELAKAIQLPPQE